jgi:hypothetical protein
MELATADTVGVIITGQALTVILTKMTVLIIMDILVGLRATALGQELMRSAHV